MDSFWLHAQAVLRPQRLPQPLLAPCKVLNKGLSNLSLNTSVTGCSPPYLEVHWVIVSQSSVLNQSKSIFPYGPWEDSSNCFYTTDLQPGGAHSQVTRGSLLASWAAWPLQLLPSGSPDPCTCHHTHHNIFPGHPGLCCPFFMSRNQNANSLLTSGPEILCVWTCHLSIIISSCWTLPTIPCCQDLPGTRSYHSPCVCVCVSACFG